MGGGGGAMNGCVGRGGSKCVCVGGRGGGGSKCVCVGGRGGGAMNGCVERGGGETMIGWNNIPPTPKHKQLSHNSEELQW